MTTEGRLVLEDAEALAQYGAKFLVDTLHQTQGQVAVCLSGGSTPKRLYELLATPPLRDRLPWDRVHWFWGDERFVPPDHPDSNYRMTRLAMLAAVPAPRDHVHPIPTEGMSPEDAAVAYEKTLQEFYGAAVLDPARPLFVVSFLGLGEDGHTASLFPGIAALAERTKWAVAVTGVKSEARISLTYPALDSASHAIFLVSGAGKRDIASRIAAGEDLPAGHVRPAGTLHWLLDKAAAGAP